MKRLGGVAMRRRVTAIAFVLATVLIELGPAGASPPTLVTTRMQGCELSLVVAGSPADQERLHARVPEPYRPGLFSQALEGFTMFTIHHFACDRVQLGRDVQHGVATVLVGIGIVQPDGIGVPGALSHAHWYTVLAHTNSARLAQTLSESGLPFEYVPRIALERLDGTLRSHVSSTVSWREGQYTFTTDVLQQDPPHFHDNGWWYDDVKLRIVIPSAIDRSCWPNADHVRADCATAITATDGTALAELIGGTHRHDGWGFVHEKLDATFSMQG